jgi:hypothetical protein
LPPLEISSLSFSDRLSLFSNSLQPLSPKYGGWRTPFGIFRRYGAHYPSRQAHLIPLLADP